MYKMIFTVMGALIGLGAFPQPQSQDGVALRKKQFNTPEGIGIKGYDPVAYFTGSKAIKGSKDQAVVYEGITYYFSSAANREAFRKDPARYEPQYGGWCAYAMGNDGSKVEVDPGTFKIVGGKLFLFYNQWFTNTLKSWNKDEVNLHRQADNNWKKIYP
ncbi:MAG TPA: YHS domain-containing (seleno)protein [Puia sp.]